MARRRRGNDDDGIGEGTWLNTYADMVTLILTFFILLFTMSSIDAEKWQVLMKAFESRGMDTQQVVLVPEGAGSEMGTNMGEGSIIKNDSLPTDQALPENFDELYRYIKNYIEENGLQASVEISKGENSVFIRFRDNIFFDPDRSFLKSNSKKILDFMGSCFNNVNDQILAIRINGHTATVPGTAKTPGFDRTLSTDRANSVLIYLEENAKVEAKKLIAIGYGRNYPINGNETEVGRKKNRRVELLILSNELNRDGADDIYALLQGDFGAELIDTIKDPENNEDILLPQ
jgi:chemotaxis protein MotB